MLWPQRPKAAAVRCARFSLWAFFGSVPSGPPVHSPGRPAATARLLLGSARRRPEPWSAREGAGGEARGGDRSPKRRRAGCPARVAGRPEPSRAGQRVVPSALAAADARCDRGCDSASRLVPTLPAPASASCRRDQSHSGPYQPRGLRQGPTMDPSPSLVSPPRTPRSGPPARGGLGFGCWSGRGRGPGYSSFGSREESVPARPAPPAHPPPSFDPGCSGP